MGICMILSAYPFCRNLQLISLSCCNLSLQSIPPVHFLSWTVEISQLWPLILSETWPWCFGLVNVVSTDFCGNGSDTSGRRFSDHGYCVQSGAQTALNGNDSVCVWSTSGKSNHTDEEGDVRQMKSQREKDWEGGRGGKTVGEGGREERTLVASRDDLKAWGTKESLSMASISFILLTCSARETSSAMWGEKKKNTKSDKKKRHEGSGKVKVTRTEGEKKHWGQ